MAISPAPGPQHDEVSATRGWGADVPLWMHQFALDQDWPLYQGKLATQSQPTAGCLIFLRFRNHAPMILLHLSCKPLSLGPFPSQPPIQTAVNSCRFCSSTNLWPGARNTTRLLFDRIQSIERYLDGIVRMASATVKSFYIKTLTLNSRYSPNGQIFAN